MQQAAQLGGPRTCQDAAVTGDEAREAAILFAAHAGTRYETRLAVDGLRLRSLEIGHTLPSGATPASVVVDGQPAHDVGVRQTNRGVEVTVPVHGDGPHTLIVTTA
jgi:hypothetical protein